MKASLHATRNTVSRLTLGASFRMKSVEQIHIKRRSMYRGMYEAFIELYFYQFAQFLPNHTAEHIQDL